MAKQQSLLSLMPSSPTCRCWARWSISLNTTLKRLNVRRPCMTHQTASAFAQSWGLVYLLILFVAVCGYALWPRNKDKFDRASRMPLEEDHSHGE
ncbi:MAG: cbb3-type cytochrome c oxidase subunit 3 [Rhodospirillaceae bacterium]